MAADAGQAHEVRIRSKHNYLAVRVPDTDIDACIACSTWRSILAFVGLLLVVTDIPRTGLGFRTSTFYPERSDVGADVVMHWGRYDTHCAYLSSEECGMPSFVQIIASRNGTRLQSIDEWPYKYDTHSVELRGVAEFLNVTSYPPCLLYRSLCATSQLEPTVVFAMLDSLVKAIDERITLTSTHSLVFNTTSIWIDRLYHVFVGFFAGNRKVRHHTVHHIPYRRLRQDGMCGLNNTSREASSSRDQRSRTCGRVIGWKYTDFYNPSDGDTIPISQHISARLDTLQQRHPSLVLDLTLFSTSLVEEARERRIIPTARVQTKTEEVVTLIRGRRCATASRCETIFIDDFRYERSWIESDVNRWVTYVSILRGFSQAYLWLRVAFLFCGCYYAWASEPRHHGRGFAARFAGAWRTLLKIPSHVVVYGSWPPLIGYALAHYFDSSLVQGVGDYAFASVGGLYRFNLIAYTLKVSIHMRNIWMIAIMWKGAFLSVNARTRGFAHWDTIKRHGLLTFRSNWIGVLSYLTTFGLMRALRFRDVLSVHALLPQPHAALGQAMKQNRNASEYGMHFDVECACVAGMLMACVVWIGKIVLRASTNRPTSAFVCRSYYVPLAAGRLWSWTILDGSWLFDLQDSTRATRVSVFPRTTDKLRTGSIDGDDVSTCRVCSFVPSVVHWRAIHGCPQHEPIFILLRRTKAIWSMVRLTNLAAMTDPLVLFRLSVMGVPLYVYRVISNVDYAPHLLLLPVPPTKTAMVVNPTRPQAWSTTRSDELEFVASVNSRDVPWHVLVNCG